MTLLEQTIIDLRDRARMIGNRGDTLEAQGTQMHEEARKAHNEAFDLRALADKMETLK